MTGRTSMKHNGIKHIVRIAPMVLWLALVSCQQDTKCRTEMNVYCKATFYMDSITQFDETKTFTVADSITVKGVGCDSVLYQNAKSASYVLLPLRSDTTLTEYAIVLNGVQDTLYIYHRNTPTFISLACGCFVYHVIDSVVTSTHLMSGAVVVDSDVANKVKDNITIRAHYPKK